MKILSYNKAFFLSLIDRLNANNIKYGIIGDYQNLPDGVGHDLDFWTNDPKTFLAVIKETAKEQDFRILFLNRQVMGAFNISFFKKVDDGICLMKIDVMRGCGYKSLYTLVDTELLRENIMPYKNFYVANPASEAVQHMLFPLFEWGKIKKDVYLDEIKANYKSEIFNKTLSKLFSEKDKNEILSFIEKGNWDDMKSYILKHKSAACRKQRLHLKFYLDFIRLISSHVKRILHPCGVSVAFCGLDGAGKTTILDILNKAFVDLLKERKVFYHYWRPFLLPEIRELFGKANSKSGNEGKLQRQVQIEDKPVKKTLKNVLISHVKLIYYNLDYILGRIKYLGIRARGGIALFDRHYIDMVVHPDRFGMCLPLWYLKLFYKIWPTADLTIFLWATPEEIHKRKVEFTKEQIREQISLYNEVGKFNKHFHCVETNKTVEEEIVEILDLISERTQKQ